MDSSTELYGVGSSLRRTYHYFLGSPTPLPPSHSEGLTVETEEAGEGVTFAATNSNANSLSPPSPSQILISEMEEAEAGGTLVATREENDVLPFTYEMEEVGARGMLVLSHDDNIFSLPDADRDLNHLEREFRDMFEHFAQYSKRDILSLRDPRMRSLFEGIAASAYEPAVYRAFEVLYEDLYPLRIAGRMIDTRMRKLMTDSQRERKEEVALVVKATGLPETDIEDSRLGFVSTAASINGDAFLTLAQLAETGLADTAVDVLGFESVESLLQRLDKNDEKKLSFVAFMTGLQECAQEVCSLEECNPGEVMRVVVSDLEEHPPQISKKLNPQKQQFSDRYDEMVRNFGEWEDLIPAGEGRRLEVVRGCFVGASNIHIVTALRVVYVDFKPLRLAGDIIYQLVSSVMAGIRRRQT
jgi:hypothetical protein